MSSPFDAVREQYERDRPFFELLAKRVAAIARERCYQAGVVCTISYRAKTIPSLVKKAIVDKLPYDRIADKAGVRIVPVYPNMIPKVCDVIRSTFDVHWDKNMADFLEKDRFGYAGHHFRLRLKQVEASELPVEAKNLVAEIQVHTLGQSLWATVNHDLSYKSAQSLPIPILRSLNRLAALAEVIDEGVTRAHREIAQLNGSPAAYIRLLLEQHFFQFTARDYNRDLSTAVITPLLPLLGDLETAAARLADFVNRKREQFTHTFADYRDDDRHPLLSQPESILLFYLIEADEMSLQRTWPDFLPETFLDNLKAVWAVS